MNRFPALHELIPAPDVAACLVRYRRLPGCLLLESARRDPKLGRYSFLMADPVATLRRTIAETSLPEARHDLFAEAARLIAAVTSPALPDLPPFQGGLAGLLGYDLNRGLEPLAAPRYDEFQFLAAVAGLYDVVLAWDHLQNRAWLISQGWPEQDAEVRTKRAIVRLQYFQNVLRSAPSDATDVVANLLQRVDLSPHVELTQHPNVLSNFSRLAYLAAVERAIEYIRAGDVFQVNLAQRLLTPSRDPAWQLYLRLRERNPANFAAYFDAGDFQLASASPERFLRVSGGRVEARPIKGTRPRAHWPEADLFAGADLQQSEKDRAENVMIVDLLRNDLSRVCEPESVTVSELCRLEPSEYVQHLVSVVEGRLAKGNGPLDLVRAAWPGGSITGAPKIRAMQIIAELEQVARGPYCGALFYLGADGSFDANLLIRTIVVARGWRQFSVGGGITTASDPRREYEETWHKAEGLLRALD